MKKGIAGKSKYNLTKEFLEDIYLNKRKSIINISNDLGIHFTTIYYNLIKYKIPIRGKRYQSYENRVKLSKKYSKLFRRPFNYDNNLKSYLMGLILGDFTARKDGFRIRVSCASTHPAQLDLFKKSLSNFAEIKKYSARNHKSPNGYTVNMYAYLDKTFSFLLNNKISDIKWIFENEGYFWNFIAAFFDCEGSLYFHEINREKGDNYLQMHVSISNNKYELLNLIKNVLVRSGLNVSNIRLVKDRNYELSINSRMDVINFIRKLKPLIKHPEKLRKINFILKYRNSKYYHEISKEWDRLRDRILKDRNENIIKARLDYINKNKLEMQVHEKFK